MNWEDMALTSEFTVYRARKYSERVRGSRRVWEREKGAGGEREDTGEGGGHEGKEDSQGS